MLRHSMASMYRIRGGTLLSICCWVTEPGLWRICCSHLVRGSLILLLQLLLLLGIGIHLQQNIS